MTLRCLLVILLAAWGAATVTAQPAPPVKGIVWTPPADVEVAAADLRAMKAAGAEAVRTEVIRRERLLTLADTLGLALWQDLPAARLSSAGLRDTLSGTTRVLDQALRWAQEHPSARHFGLARGSDTSTPATCAYVEALARRVAERGPPGSQTYYATPFVEADPCAPLVDVVLLEGLSHPAPAALLRRWQAARPDTLQTGVGLAALGTFVDADAAQGLQQPHSPEAQARYLETHLAALLDTTAGGAHPAALFVYRWRDHRPGGQPLASADLYPQRRYGLHTLEGAARPALQVVRGLYTGRQAAFVFPAGAARAADVPWAVVLAWSVVLGVGVLYAAAPRFRRLTGRYFRARGFYREAVREGRNALAGTVGVLLGAASLSAGLLIAALFLAAQDTGPFRWWAGGLDPSMRAQVPVLLERPWLVVFLAGAFYASALLLWALLLSLTSRRYFFLQTDQVLLLVVGPHWPLLVLMAGAAATLTLPARLAVPVALILVAAWMLVALAATARALYDYAALTRMPGWAVAGLALLSPPIVLGLVVLFKALEAPSDVAFLWHLATRA